MAAPTKFLDRNEVDDWKSYASYVQQQTGIPYPTSKEIPTLRKTLREFFDDQPNANYFTLCRIVDWAKARKRRYASVYGLVCNGWKYAWADGYLPELDPDYQQKDEDLEALITAAIEREDNPEWVRRLIVAQGNESRRRVYEAWLEERGS